MGRVIQTKSWPAWLGIIALIGWVLVGTASYDRSIAAASPAISIESNSGATSIQGSVVTSAGQQETPQVTDMERQNLYAAIAGFVVAGIPVYLIWRRRKKNK